MSEFIIIIPFMSWTYYLDVKGWKAQGLIENATTFDNEKQAETPLHFIKKKYLKAYIKQVK